MRLFSKSEILTKKASAKKLEIDEGKKLAGNIDRLREVRAEEESSLEKFRVATIATIHEETSDLEKKRDALKNEVSDLEKRKREALMPLDEKEILLNNRELQIQQKEQEIEGRIVESEEVLTKAKERERKANKNLIRSEGYEDEARKKLEDAQNVEEQAKLTLKNAQVLEQKARTKKDAVDTKFIHREKRCADREKSIILAEAKQKAEKTELRKGWKLLNDRIATFERTLNRNKP